MTFDTVAGWVGTPTGTRCLTSVAVVVLVLVARSLVQRRIDANADVEPTLRMRWTAQTRVVALTLVGLGLLFIWGEAVRDFVLSLVVLASALVVATKELIMCLTGSLVRATSQGFAIGDRLELGAVRGDVVDVRLLTTVLLESGPSHERTGRRLVIPNSVYLTQAVANETFTQAYVLHSFEVPLEATDPWRAMSARMSAIAEDVAGEHVGAARTHMEAVSARHALPPFDVAPRVSVVLRGPVPTLRVRVPTPARLRGRVEQDILEAFLSSKDPADAALSTQDGDHKP